MPVKSLAIVFGVGALLFLLVGPVRPGQFSSTHFTVFVLACFVGWHGGLERHTPLHTPLMSVTNAIRRSSRSALVQIAHRWPKAPAIDRGLIGVPRLRRHHPHGRQHVRRFAVTRRMLAMFRK